MPCTMISSWLAGRQREICVIRCNSCYLLMFSMEFDGKGER